MVLSKKQPALLVTDCQSLHDAIHKEGAASSSTNKRLAIELVVMSRATEGEADLRWIHARYQIADCVSPSTHLESLKRCYNKESIRHSGGSWQRKLEARREERGQEGFVRKRVRAEDDEATLFLRNANAEVRTMSHLLSA